MSYGQSPRNWGLGFIASVIDPPLGSPFCLRRFWAQVAVIINFKTMEPNKTKKHPVDKMANDCHEMMDGVYQAAMESNREMAKAVSVSASAVQSASQALSKLLDANAELREDLRNKDAK